MRKFLALSLLLILFGCGASSPDQPQSSGILTGAIPIPQPGSSPQSQPLVTIHFTNQSTHIPTADWLRAVDNINYQIQHDLNPRWGCNGVAVVADLFDPLRPSVLIQDREDGLGGYTDGTVGRVAYRTNTAHLWSAYCSHVAINLLTPGYLAGQSVEAYDYRRSDYAEREPWELADFDFPSAHGLGGTYYDHAGQPAHDLLHKLAYP